MNAAGLALRPFTVVRTRLYINVNSDQVAASESYRGAFGMIVVSDQAIAAGVGSVPKPLADTDADWFVYEPYAGGIEFATAAAFIEPSGLLLTVDSKAMRKVGKNEDIAGVFEGAGNGILSQMTGRFLVKLH